MNGWPFEEHLEFWLWEYTDEFGKRRRSTWRMIEETAKSHRDAEKVEGSVETPRPIGSTSSFLQSPEERWPEGLLTRSNAAGSVTR